MFKFLKSLKKRKALAKRKMNPYVIYAAIVIIILAPVIYIVNHRPKESDAAWFDDGWLYRQRVPITNAGTAQTDFQVGVTINTSALITAGKMQADCDDIRVTGENGEQLPYWIEENNPGCNSTTTLVWVKVPSIPVSTSGINIYAYYGNPSAVAASDGNTTFPFFDDFNGDSLDDAKWNVSSASAGITESGGALTITTGGIYTANPILTAAQGYTYEQRFRLTSTVGSRNGISIADEQSTTASNSGSNKLIYLISQGGGNYNVGAFAANGTTSTYNIADNTLEYTATASTYHISGYSMDASNVRFYNNRTQTNSYAGTWTSNVYMFLGFFLGAAGGVQDVQDSDNDWVIVHKFAATPPVVGTLATEEQSPGPILSWKFDEGAGTTLNDSTTNDNNATLAASTATPVWQPEDKCISGKCLQFDGVDDYATSGEDTFYSDTFSVCAWVRPNFLDGNPRSIFVKRNSSGVTSGTPEWQFTATATNLEFATWTTGSVVAYDVNSATPLKLNAWSHVCGVQQGTGNPAFVYINGQEQGTATQSGATQNTASHITIGGRTTNNNARFWNGFIDEAKIYPYARSAAEIKTDYIKGATAAGSNSTLGGAGDGYLSDGLVGYWKMDETSFAGGVSDSSGVGNTASANGDAASTITAKFGRAGTFDGTSDFIAIPDNAAYDFPDDSFSFATWFKTPNTGTDRGIFYMLNGGGYFYININASGAIVLTTADSTGAVLSPSSTATYTDAAWHHIVTSRSKSNQKLDVYVDGVNIISVSDTRTGNFNASNFVQSEIGGGFSVTFFSGQIDDFRIYNRALNQGDVIGLYNWAPGPIAYYNFNENTGTSTSDISGNSNTGTLGGSTTPIWTNGEFGSALNFDGVSQKVTAPDSTSLSITSFFSIGTWVKPESLPASGNQMSLVSKYDVGANVGGYDLRLENVAGVQKVSLVMTNAGASGGAVVTYTLPLNTWSYVTGVYDGVSTIMYINGSEIGRVANTATPSDNTKVLNIGTFGTLVTTGLEQPRFFDGALDDVRIYNYARTRKQVVQDMNAGHPSVGSPIGSPVGYWKFDEGFGTATNNSGNGGAVLVGTLTNMANPATAASGWSNDGKFAKAISFDGTNDYVSIPNSTALSPEAGDITVSMWVNLDVVNGTERWLYDDHGVVTSNLVLLRINITNKFQAYFGDGSGNFAAANSITTPVAGTWYHLVGVRNGTTSSFYLNGKKEGSATNASLGTISTSAGVTPAIGRNNLAGTQFMDGRIDDVKVYMYALTDDEVKADYNQAKSEVLGSTSTTSAGVGDNSTLRQYCVPGDASTCSPPVMEFRFDENTGTTANDTSGNNINGTLGATTAAPIWTPGILGPALSFDGVNDTVSTATNVFANSVFSGGMTFSAWVKPVVTALAADPIILSVEGGYYLAIDNVDNKYIFMADGNASAGKSVSTAVLDQWTFVVGTYDGTNSKIYVNGQLENTYAQTRFNIDSISRVTAVGQHSVNVDWFNGVIDNPQIYNYARSQAQIAWDYNKGGPTAWYKMDECQGTDINNTVTTFDGSPAGNDGTLTIGGTGTNTVPGTCSTTGAWADGAAGKYSSAMGFDGTDDFVDFGDNTFFEINAPLSLSAWVNEDTLSANGETVIAKYASTGNQREYYILIINGAVFFSKFADGTAATQLTLNSSTVMQTGTWYHVLVTFDASANANIYINGKLDASSTMANATIFHGTAAARIGRLAAGGVSGDPFDGKIDDVKIFNYALTSAQAKTEYNAGAVRFE